MQQEHPALGPVAMGGAFQDVHEVRERSVETEDGILSVVVWIVEELVASDFVFIDDHLLGPLAEDHLVDALVGGPGDRGVIADDIEVISEAAVPVFLLVVRQVLAAGNQRDQIRSCRHERCSSSRWIPSVRAIGLDSFGRASCGGCASCNCARDVTRAARCGRSSAARRIRIVNNSILSYAGRRAWVENRLRAVRPMG